MTRHATAQTCKTCGAPVLTGTDADTCGIPVTVDRDPVDNFGEAVAVLTGRATYDLARRGSGQATRRQLEPRTAVLIRDGLRRYPVHAEHLCGQPLPAAPAVEHVTGWSVAGGAF